MYRKYLTRYWRTATSHRVHLQQLPHRDFSRHREIPIAIFVDEIHQIRRNRARRTAGTGVERPEDSFLPISDGRLF